MRILVYPHSMEIGGSQLNAIEIAGALSRRGHWVTVLCEDGGLVTRVEELGLRRVAIPGTRRRPSLAVARVLRSEAMASGIDILYGFEWPPAIEAWAACSTLSRARAVGTVMSMDVPPFLPPSLPLTMGTRDLVERARGLGMPDVQLLEPPVDTEWIMPDTNVQEFRVKVPALPGIADIVVVGRLATELKLAGLLEALHAVARLPDDVPARLVIVGDGPARQHVQEVADRVNAETGRQLAVLAGEMKDPRGAYSAATLCLGMGGSALRAAASGRPVVVQGVRGFWSLLKPDNAADFAQTGWFGIGPGVGGVERLQSILTELLRDERMREELGPFSRRWVEDRYSLTSTVGWLEGWFEEVLAQPWNSHTRIAQALGATPSVRRLFTYKVRRKWDRHRGRVALEDFNVLVR